jgi:hypothetical protein
MTDWSGGSRRRRNRSDAIWIAYGDIEDAFPKIESPPSKTEAIELIRSLPHEWVTSRSRVLVCFDFAFGYPVDFAVALESATGKSDLPWRLVWQYLNETVKETISTPNLACSPWENLAHRRTVVRTDVLWDNKFVTTTRSYFLHRRRWFVCCEPLVLAPARLASGAPYRCPAHRRQTQATIASAFCSSNAIYRVWLWFDIVPVLS